MHFSYIDLGLQIKFIVDGFAQPSKNIAIAIIRQNV